MQQGTHRTEAVTTRLTRAERAIVEAAAIAMDLPRSSAIRELLLPAAHRRIENVRPGRAHNELAATEG